MMKALKAKGGVGDADRVMTLLDSVDINICGDEGLLDTVPDTLSRLRETHRLRPVPTMAGWRGGRSACGAR